MPKIGRDDAYWENICNGLAAGKTASQLGLGNGWQPGAHSKWKAVIQKILACGETKKRQSSSQTLPFGGTVTCTCNWDHNNKTTTTAAAAATAAAAPPPPPPKEVDFGFLCKPTARKIADIKNKYDVKSSKGCYDLELFGYTDGKCPHCKSPNIYATNVNNSVKMIFTSHDPRFVQGIGLKCRDCEGSQWQSYEKTYVDTLSKKQQNELHAVVSGKRVGVDMGLIMDMRLGATASSIARKSLAHVTKRHAELEEEYEMNCQKLGALGFNVVEREFPGLKESGMHDFVAKSDIVTMAFLRDYISVEPQLLRELGSLKSQISMAVDHQKKVVKHAKGHGGASSFSVVGDGGIVLGYYVVPDDGERWVQHAMKEIVERHGAVLNNDLKTVLSRGDLPEVIYVDKLCCGGTEGSRADAVRYFYGMLKKLDVFHLIQRIGREINCEHPRKGGFLKSLSENIFTKVTPT